MQYLLSFLEGFITFVSPCLLPMLPVYISYFAGQNTGKKHKAAVNALGFVLGFTILFVILGAFAGTLGSFLRSHMTAVNIITGIIIILFGLNFMEIIRLPFINNIGGPSGKRGEPGFFSSMLFGIVFSVSWTPCVGTFLGSALMLAAQSGESIKGIFMLLSFSLGLGIPFVVSAVMIDKLKGAFDFIKKHYKIINRISGAILILLGLLIATGLIGYLYALI
ncbi:MAG: cytochrome c biogenesis CcdA family protein [Eubacteriales bacterium]